MWYLEGTRYECMRVSIIIRTHGHTHVSKRSKQENNQESAASKQRSKHAQRSPRARNQASAQHSGPPAEGPGGGPPAEGPGGGAARTAVGHRRRRHGAGGRGGEIDWGGDTSGYYTKHQKTMQIPNTL